MQLATLLFAFSAPLCPCLAHQGNEIISEFKFHIFLRRPQIHLFFYLFRWNLPTFLTHFSTTLLLSFDKIFLLYCKFVLGELHKHTFKKSSHSSLNTYYETEIPSLIRISFHFVLTNLVNTNFEPKVALTKELCTSSVRTLTQCTWQANSPCRDFALSFTM